jgi:hypothetical protein
VRFVEVALMTSLDTREEIMSFYLDHLEFPGSSDTAVRIGESRLLFAAAESGATPFYHFAFLVPGNRFTPALEWLRTRTPLLPDPETGSEVFDFDNWRALACYFHDPGGNIVEFIAHRDLDESTRDGPFTSSELVGLSELGLVCPDKRASARALEALGANVWDGDVDDPQRLAFVGVPGRTLILCPSSRPWLPTDRAAEIHPTRVVLEGVSSAELELPGAPHVLVGRPVPKR